MKTAFVGADVEVLLWDEKKGVTSAFGLLGGSKESPRKTKNGAIQEDGVLAEFNVIPASSASVFGENVGLILKDLTDIITPLNLGYRIDAAAYYPEDQLVDPRVCRSGCDPDYDAWNMRINSPPSLEGKSLRSCGGHVHISWEGGENFSQCIKLVKFLDVFLGIPSVRYDRDVLRRTLFGKAGCHRVKRVSDGAPYDGVEYRTLSNFWIASKGMREWVFFGVELALETLRDRSSPLHNLIEDEDFSDEVQRIINCGDKNSSRHFFDNWEIKVN